MNLVSTEPLPSPTARRLLADRFHSGVRVAALGFWVLFLAGVYWLVLQLAAMLGLEIVGVGYFVAGFVALVISQPFSLFAERYLIRWWPSGRQLVLEPTQLQWQDRRPPAKALPFHKKVNFWRWRFALKRRRGGRIPSGYHCLALRLVQDELVVTVYTFAAPKHADTLHTRFPFYELRREKEAGHLSIGGRDAVYLAAEDARWNFGAELEPADFEALLVYLGAHVPEFGQAPNS